MPKLTPVRYAATTVTLAAAFSLAACVGSPTEDAADQPPEGASAEMAEEAIEDATGGEADVEFGEVPEGFPDDVPLVSENVIQSVTIDDERGSGTSLTISDPRPPAEVAEAVREDFSGWEETAWSDMGEMVTGQFMQGDTTVILAVIEDDGGSHVQYMVFTG
ncbi:hypothetical protein M4I32_03715 [Microbacterium sp. LRZ72]|uniref:hypothetical protein n=1 Tax=Microbacterium sp. LRZ72 TaxID=2942481 RepID=UPI0029A34258|nr:hypothetical protein [Microbacterium sp. LRZ72]MDX2375904.1 hypothetical protein [Microbacterium sp. LRZ72]